MLAELLLYLALAFLLISAAAAFAPHYHNLAVRALGLQTLCITLSFVALVIAHLNNHFAIASVANNSYIDLANYYKLSATWASHQGSLLLWLMLQSAYSLALMFSCKKLALAYRQRLLLALALINLGLLLFALGTSSPFASAPLYQGVPYTIFGRDLNPMLQDPLMAIHPPLLYIGYIGFSANFALLLALLLGQNLQQELAQITAIMRRYNLFALGFLTLGIGFGSLWAYRELGFGGFWFWDAVENASLIPWLLAVALLHALRAPKLGLSLWVALLAMAAYMASLFGTFVVRSGVLLSVHNFASDGKQAVLLLIWISALVMLAALLLAYKLPLISTKRRLRGGSLLLLGNVILFASACFTVMLGTLAPLAYKLLGSNVTIGSAYFNSFMPIFIAIAMLGMLAHFLLGKIKWRLFLYISAPLFMLAAVMIHALLHYVYGSANWLISSLLALMLLATLGQISLLRRSFAAVLAHLALLMMALSVMITHHYSQNYTVKLQPQQTVQLGGFQLELLQIETPPRGRYPLENTKLHLRVNQSSKVVAELNHYLLTGNTMREVGLDSNWRRDLYLVAGEKLADNTYLVNIQYKPLQRWLWLGVLLMAIALALPLRRQTRSTRL